ncbi:MAG: hypothetical protein PHV74_03190 [Dehalococcoidia bacterium]|nr:hypothetical protein [Dehalococcoidia bacterium]
MKKSRKRAGKSIPPRQLRLALEPVECRYEKECAAPMCPRDINFGGRIWFPKEPICRLRSAPEWVRKQREIARLPGIDADRYFTFRMLKAVPEICHDLQGANPDYVTAERIWFKGWIGRKAKKRAPASDAGLGKPLF